MRILGVIPARYASTRLPGKPLVDIGGQSMVQRVVVQARQAVSLEAVVVATDDVRIVEHEQGNGGTVVMTSPDHQRGTDRCWEALEHEG
ncbi:MAG: 3-deoxy-manno-octulosonate cytidylyltransferase, partial [Flavobacteriales bacterium]